MSGDLAEPLPLGVRYMEYLFMVSGVLHSLA